MTGRQRGRAPTHPEIAAQASAHSGAPGSYLDGYLEILVEVAATGRRLRRDEVDGRRALGVAAAEAAVPLPALVALYLKATEVAFGTLPGVARSATASDLRLTGTAVLAAAEQAVAALGAGYQSAEQQAVASEHAARREFVDDLLSGTGHLGRLAERAGRFGLRLASSHAVTVARTGDQLTDADPLVRRVGDALAGRFGARNLLVTTREGLLVCVAPGSLRGLAGELAHQVYTCLGTERGWRIGVGRPHTGAGGAARSFDEARNALHLADRLGLTAPVLKAADLLVFPVLLRDGDAIRDLVDTVLGPLAAARGGPGAFLETLGTFFACQCNSAATARRLGIGVRSVSYRLDRVRRLTGYDPHEATQRFTLETAVLGARLLGWPDPPG